VKTLNNKNLRFNPCKIFDAIGQWHQIEAIGQWHQFDAIGQWPQIFFFF
jgi:hypothetical protein